MHRQKQHVLFIGNSCQLRSNKRVPSQVKRFAALSPARCITAAWLNDSGWSRRSVNGTSSGSGGSTIGRVHR